MAFVGIDRADESADTPVDLYDRLVRRSGSSSSLWAHQSAMLSAYSDKFVDDRDVALELPTGTGKTLVGLLVAEWYRRTKNCAVLYACPTVQLAESVVEAATKEGIRASLLVGSHHSWDPRQAQKYFATEQIAVTTYSSVFNTNPQIGSPGLIIFDDAHAAEQYVAEAYSLSVKSIDDPIRYKQLVDAVRPSLDGVFYEQCVSSNVTHSSRDIRLIVPLQNPTTRKHLVDVIAKLDSEQVYPARMIRPGISSCLIYVSPADILIRPYLPPTHINSPFANAKHIYLSATLGNSGELERSFGVSRIKRIPLPATAGKPESGRKFFVFPTLTEDGDSESITKRIIEIGKKAVVITSDRKTATKVASAVSPDPSYEIGDSSFSQSVLNGFRSADHGVLPLAGRFDGIDLPGDSCRVIVLVRQPGQASLQERFMLERAGIFGPLGTRVRSRFTQAAGRCTRGQSDHAVVVVYDSDLVSYLSRELASHSLEPSLAGEVRFGIKNSEVGDDNNTIDNVTEFLEQSDAWFDVAEPALREVIDRERATWEGESGDLRSAVNYEVRAFHAAWDGSLELAVAEGVKTLNELARVEGSEPFRAFISVLSSTWASDVDEAVGRGPAESQQLMEDGIRLSRNAPWLRDIATGADRSKSEAPADAIGIDAITRLLAPGAQGPVARQLEQMTDDLAATQHEKFEAGLVSLGTFLGADSEKPVGEGRADAAWRWGQHQWLILDAKSEHKPSGQVSQGDIRQVNTQIRDYAGDLGVEAPVQSASIIVSPKSAVHTTASATPEPHVHLIDLDIVRSTARRLRGVWEEMLAGASISDSAARRALVSKKMNDAGLLATDVFETFTLNPLSR